MKVKELIEQLKSLDPELTVVRPGYEGGYCEVGQFVIEEMVRDHHDQWYYGPHEAVSVVDLMEPNQTGDFTAVIIT